MRASTLPDNCSMSPLRLSFFLAATSAAKPLSDTAFVHPAMPSEPSEYRTFAARTASEPKMMFKAALRCCCDNPLSEFFNCPAKFSKPTKLPDASYALMPSSSICAWASLVGFDRRCSIVFSEVPASEPIMPAFANAANVPTVSVMLTPMLLAIRPAWFNARPRSWAEPTALPAPAASASATLPASAPSRLNCLSVVLISSAASPTCMPSDAARFNAPDRPPERMSAVDRPALPNASMPSAASFAL